MHILRTATSLHFMLAIAVAFVLSISLATAASMTGLMPDARVDPHKPAFWTPLTHYVRDASVTNTGAAARHQSSAPTRVSATQPRAGL